VVQADALSVEGDRDSPPLLLRRRLAWIAAGLGAWLAFRILLFFPDAAEVLLGSGPLPLATRGLSLVSGAVPFSLAEWLVLAFLVRQGVGAVGGLREIRRGRDRWTRTLARGGLRVGQDVGILVLLFYLLWGFHYARPGLDSRLGLAASGELSVAELEELAHHAVEAANRAYVELHGTRDAGHPTPILPPDSLVPALEAGWRAVAARFHLPGRLEQRHGAPKTWLATPLLRRMGVSGMYFPFTAEALALGDLPGARMPTTLAHEMAHQRAVTSESDANALAFLVAREAPHPQARYAAHLFVRGQFLTALAGVCPECADPLRDQQLPGVWRDLDDLTRYWLRSRGPISEAAGRVNHAMLRSHGIPEGRASYRGSTWILAALALQEGPAAFFGAESVPGEDDRPRPDSGPLGPPEGRP
jgi:hypothetical protein